MLMFVGRCYGQLIIYWLYIKRIFVQRLTHFLIFDEPNINTRMAKEDKEKQKWPL